MIPLNDGTDLRVSSMIDRIPNLPCSDSQVSCMPDEVKVYTSPQINVNNSTPNNEDWRTVSLASRFLEIFFSFSIFFLLSYFAC